MSVKITSVNVDTITRQNQLKQSIKITRVCAAIENTGSKKMMLEIDFLARAKKTSFSSRKVFAKVCALKKVEVGPRVDLGEVSANGYKLLCCEIPNNIAADVFNFGGDYLVVIGNKRDKNGDIESNIDVSTSSVATKIAMLPGEHKAFSDILGVGFEDMDKFNIELASDVPLGWQVNVNEAANTKSLPSIVNFDVVSRPGAFVGESATVVLRTFLENKTKEVMMIEESVFTFEVGQEQVCCDCDKTFSDVSSHP